jgi:DNA-binding LytR/AlgR family response regulator
MFIKVTGFEGSTVLVNTDKIYCVVEHGRKAEVVYIDDSSLMIKESINDIERMLKGADDGEMA